MREITFVVTEDEIDGGYTARSHWPEGNRDLFTEGDTREELVRNIREVVDLSFEQDAAKPDLIHLHYVRDEVIAR
jgi:predicted RNase H-like HicB family nuclease